MIARRPGGVLNHPPLRDGHPPGPALARDLQALLLRLETGVSAAEERDPFLPLQSHPAFREAETLARRLPLLPLETLTPRSEALAFWINLYNALVTHSLIAFGVPRNPWAMWRFFDRGAYRVGPHTFTPNAIEHGVLRGNRSFWRWGLRPFGVADPRASLVLDPPDPRIHFALNCGASSCPAIRVYHGERVDADLDLAARGYLNGEAREVSGRVRLPRLLKWYRDDFARAAGSLEAFVLRYLDPGRPRAALEAGRPVFFDCFDWRLRRLHGEEILGASPAPAEGSESRI